MVKRKIHFRIYLAALIITSAIFFIGVFIGQLSNQQVVNDLQSKIQDYYQQSYPFELIMLLDNSSDFCPVYLSELEILDKAVIDLGFQLSYLEDVKGVSDNGLKKDYFILEAKSYFLSQILTEKCNSNDKLILYFYSNINCDNCKAQGEELTKATEGKNAKRYSFDGTLESPIVEAFKQKYNILKYPTIVIDDEILVGFHSSKDLNSYLK